MAAMVTVLATAMGLVCLGVCEVRDAQARRAFRRRLRALAADRDAWAVRERIRGVVA